MHSTRLTMTWFAALASLALTFPAASASAAPSGPPVVIGAILSMTGNYAPLGEPERNALQLAEKDINAAGGINGRPLQIKILDDEGKADTAKQLATQLLGEKVAMLICCSLTATSAAVASSATDAKVVQLYMTPTQPIWNTKNGVAKYIFEVTPRNELEGQKLVAFIKTKLHGAKVAVLHDEGPYGTTGAGVFGGEAKSGGLNVVDDEAFAIAATDLTPQLQKAKNAGADTIVIWTASPAAAILVKQAHQFGMKSANVGSTGIVSDNFLKVAAKDSEGVYADMSLDLTYPDAADKKFIDAYKGAYGRDPNNFAAYAWDAVHVAAFALSSSKVGSGDAIAQTLETMKPLHGAVGVFKFTPTDHNGLSADDIKIVVAKNQAWVTLR